MIVLLAACSSESSKIKTALKQTIPAEMLKNYKLKEYRVQETILDVNLQDSISSLQSSIRSNEMLIQSDSLRLLEIQSGLESCKRAKSNTLYWLRSSYNSLISDYEDMESEVLDKINSKLKANAEANTKISEMEDAIKSSDSPIVFFKVRHIYTLRGLIRDTTITLNSNYLLIQ